MTARRWILLSSVLASGACTSDAGQDAESVVIERRTTPIDVTDMGDLDAVALQLEDYVAVGDVGGIEAMWLEPERLRGCRLGKDVELPNDRLREFLPDRKQRFVERAQRTLSARWGGNLVYTRTWAGPREILGGRLRGEECPAEAFGRVWIYVRSERRPKLVEHRFNLERVAGEWRVFGYRARKASCEKDEWANGPMCNRLANSRPKSPKRKK